MADVFKNALINTIYTSSNCCVKSGILLNPEEVAENVLLLLRQDNANHGFNKEIQDAFHKMLLNEQSGGTGWWSGWNALKQAMGIKAGQE